MTPSASPSEHLSSSRIRTRLEVYLTRRRLTLALPWFVLAGVVALRADIGSAPAPSSYPPFEVISRADELADKAYAILKENCFGCHGTNKRSGLDMRTEETLQAGGSKGKVIVAHEPMKSRLYLYATQEHDIKMPPPPNQKLDEPFSSH